MKEIKTDEFFFPQNTTRSKNESSRDAMYMYYSRKYVHVQSLEMV